ncbi:flagellin [Phaeobacter sp. 11ANDIMAR09]|mgnify:CR=1 FL=1|uniref:flagellin n=1 Tax=Phaeobacter sp. 11ANDIMAR09 TaxID=1225647 RepID=UPI0006C8BF71|nr:flagellin [Phaeobacter sp. 11ANDIMAR09]KPD14330.1 flagellar biosynthesis protein FlgL [Phaeobacter sp. 11ANDIMAR09]
MIYNSYGDLTTHSFLRNRNAELKLDLATLSEEVSTGKKSNLTEELGGDFSYLADIENSLKRIESQTVATGETKLFALSIQDSLARVQEGTQQLRDDIYSVSPALTENDATQFAKEAERKLEAAIGSFNGWAGGRSLFAGTATGTSPLNSADTLMTELIGEVSGLTDADDIIQAVKDWFADPTGFDTAMYNGSTTDIAPVEVGAGEKVSLSLRADDDNLKSALQSYAIIALLDEPALGLSADTKTDLTYKGGGELADSTERLITAQADIGFMEAQLERVSARNLASKTALSLAFNDIVLADQYEVSAKMKTTETQLEILYTVTARSAQLSLVKHM